MDKFTKDLIHDSLRAKPAAVAAKSREDEHEDEDGDEVERARCRCLPWAVDEWAWQALQLAVDICFVGLLKLRSREKTK